MTERRSTDATEPPATSWAAELVQHHRAQQATAAAVRAARASSDVELRAAITRDLRAWLDELESACRAIVAVVAEAAPALELVVARVASRAADEFTIAVRSGPAGAWLTFYGNQVEASLVIRSHTRYRGATSPEPFALISGALCVPTLGATPAGVARTVLGPWLNALLAMPGVVLTSLREPATERAIEEGATS